MAANLSPITAATRVARRADILANPLLDQTVMLDIQRGRYFGLDDIASAIWAMLEAPLLVDELCTRLVAVYEVDEATCRRDVIAHLERLRAEGLLAELPVS
jgi:hypothetical protein